MHRTVFNDGMTGSGYRGGCQPRMINPWGSLGVSDTVDFEFEVQHKITSSEFTAVSGVRSATAHDTHAHVTTTEITKCSVFSQNIVGLKGGSSFLPNRRVFEIPRCLDFLDSV